MSAAEDLRQDGRLRTDLRKGWCPGALRPMAARDGLLVRLKITGGILSAALAHRIADLATRHGNGLLDLSARANLQLRGVRDDTFSALLDGLCQLHLLDTDPAGEAVRNVLCSPMAGLYQRGEPGRPDIRPLAAALEAALVADPALHALPSKFGILLDDGGTPSLAGMPADLRFEHCHDGFRVGMGGTAAGSLDLGLVSADVLVGRAIALCRRLLEWPGGAHRPAALLRAVGRDALAAWFDVVPSIPGSEAARVNVVGLRTFDGIPALGLAAPFGRLDAAMLHAAADACADRADGGLRLTPWRTILLPWVTTIAQESEALDRFIVEPGDPRLRIAACSGAPGCERGTTDAQADAARLAPELTAMPDDGIALHVSGCAKGCAHPRSAAVTLVARDGRYDLVRNGRPGDRAARSGLTFEDARTAVRTMVSEHSIHTVARP